MNWFSGVASIILASNNHFMEAALCIIIAAIFDFFDGFVARLINAQSEIGVQLDSLADSVSFGLAPGFIIFQYLNEILVSNHYLALLGFIPSAAAVTRLAIFNVKQAGENDFSGLASPAYALFIVGLVLSSELYEYNFVCLLTDSFAFWLIVSISLAVLMLLPLRMFSLKFKHLRWKSNQFRYIFIVISLSMFPFLKIITLPLVIILYIIMSIVYHLYVANSK